LFTLLDSKDFFGLTIGCLASVVVSMPLWEGDGDGYDDHQDRSVVVVELRSVGYMESTIGQYGKAIKALTDYAKRRGAHVYTPALGAGFTSMTTSPRRSSAVALDRTA
jgi:hypothetical protein